MDPEVRELATAAVTALQTMATFDRQDEEAERQREDARQRHEEAMAALTALIERTAPQAGLRTAPTGNA